jgi:hypothetical protein
MAVFGAVRGFCIFLAFFEILDESGDDFIRTDFGGCATCDEMYEFICCLQMGQDRLSRVEVLRQAAQKVCPHEIVIGLRKTVMQMGQPIS